MATVSNTESVYSFLGSATSFKDIVYDWHGANEALFLMINSLHSPTYDLWMQVITRAGEHENFLYYITAITAYALLTLLVKKITNRGGIHYHISMWFGVLAVLLVGYAAIGVSTKIMKHSFAMPRPYVVLEHQAISVWEQNPIEEARLSFPSGHAMFITLMVIGLWPALSVNMRWLGLALMLVVSWSRIALGVHFPADVVWGMIISSIIVGTLRTVLYGFFRKLRINC